MVGENKSRLSVKGEVVKDRYREKGGFIFILCGLLHKTRVCNTIIRSLKCHKP